MNVSVVGLGKIGLPLAIQIATAGHSVIGIDINEKVVNLINNAIEPFPNEPGLKNMLVNCLISKKFLATTNFEFGISNADVVLIVVPLIVNDSMIPDFASIDIATSLVGKNLKRGSLIIFETTLPIGTTSGRFKKILESVSKLTASQDFFLAYSPERVSSGSVFSDLKSYPKLVGGLCKSSTDKAAAFYSSVLEFDIRPELPKPNGVWELANCETAEFVKLAETVYRDVNIGLANEFADLAETKNIDIYKVIEAANSQPFSKLHTPGISVGGHCIPVYPYFYMEANTNSEIVKAARNKNHDMPAKCKHIIQNVFGSDLSNLKVLILGAVYRQGVKEVAFSGAYEIKKNLEKLVSKIQVHDTLMTLDEITQSGFESFSGDWKEFDIIILHTPSQEYNEIKFSQLPNLKLIIDGRNFFSPNQVPNNIKLFTYGIGWKNKNQTNSELY